MVTLDKETVLIQYPFNDSHYHFHISRAGEKFGDTNYSDWIIHLAGKTWATMPMLFELANLLKKYAPDIDWKGSLEFAKKRML